MWVAIVIVVVVVLVVLWAVASYNRLIRARTRTEQAWSGIDVQLRRRYDLVPNLVETVKGYAAHERETLEDVVAARQQGLAAHDPAAAGAAQAALGGALGRLFALAEAYPALKADRAFLELQEELTSTEDKIAYARQFYNDAVRDYDVRRQTFPASLVARMAGAKFPPKPYFEIGDPEARGPDQDRFSRRPTRPRPVARAAGPTPARPRGHVFDEIASNKRRSWLLLIAFVVVVVAVGWLLGALLGGLGWGGLVLGLVVAGVGSVTAWYSSDKVALRMARARPVDPESSVEARRLHNLVEGLCIAAGLPMPRLYVVDDPAPNAFATGRNPEHAAIAVTTGLLARMNRVELEAVLAHELGHVKNYDILTNTIAATLVGGLVIATDLGARAMFFGGLRRRNDNANPLALPFLVIGILGLVLAPIAARLMQLALSRRRESLADFTGVSLTRYPPGLISALEKLRDDGTVVQARSRATAHMWIESPIDTDLSHPGTKLNRLFLTHPPIEERIAALREL